MATSILSKISVNTEKTVHLNDSEKYYTKLDNDTIRMRIDGDPITAKDIWIDALTCRDDWLFTTPNIASRHNIDPKKAQRLLTRLVKSGVAERRKVTDPKTGKIIMHHYIFYESPLDKKVDVDTKKTVPPLDKNCPVDKTTKPIESIDENNDLSTGQKLSSGTYIENKHKKEQQASPPPDPPKKPPIPDKMKASLSGSGIYPSQVYKSIEQFGDEYTMAAIEIAKTGERSIPGYFRFLTAEMRDSVKDRVIISRKNNTISESVNSNDDLRKNEGKTVVYKGNEYVVDESGSIQTEYGCYNKYQIDRAIAKGIMACI